MLCSYEQLQSLIRQSNVGILYRNTGDCDAATRQYHRPAVRCHCRRRERQNREKLLRRKTRRPAIITTSVPDEEIKAKTGICVDNKGTLIWFGSRTSTKRGQPERLASVLLTSMLGSAGTTANNNAQRQFFHKPRYKLDVSIHVYSLFSTTSIYDSLRFNGPTYITPAGHFCFFFANGPQPTTLAGRLPTSLSDNTASTEILRRSLDNSADFPPPT